MPSSSGTYDFQSIEVELIIREAFERIGISGEFVEPIKLESAKRSINFLLLEWMSKSINLWTLKSIYVPLVTGKQNYEQEERVSDIIQANLRTSTRQLNGTASSSEGIAVDAFDGNPSTACTQVTADGYIAYDYGEGVTQKITFFGIQPNVDDVTSIISVEYSSDNINWIDLPLNIAEISVFEKGVLNWYDIITPVEARYYRVKNFSVVPLDIQEIYFNNNTIDFAITKVSKYEYNTYPNKYLLGRPSVYYFDRQAPIPSLAIWPTASAQYNCLFLSYKQMMQDAGSYTDSLDIPSTFYPALVWGLSWQLALKYNPQLTEMLKNEYEQAFSIATNEDTENVPIHLGIDDSSYRE